MLRVKAAVLALSSVAVLCAPAAASENTVPDFTGRWGRNAFNFEPLPSGPRPVDNLMRRPDGTNDLNALVGDYRNPILKPEAAEVVRQKGLISLSGTAFPDPSNQCWPYSPPYLFAMQLGLEMLQEKDQITILYNQDDQVRRIFLNAEHPRDLKPSAMGHSIGHYEGDTLVVDTVGVKVGPHAMVDRYGTPFTEALRVVERYRLIPYEAAKEAAERHQRIDGVAGLGGNVRVDPDYKGPGLELHVTVEDPNVFTMPWSALITYRRIGGAWAEQVCAENIREYYDDKDTAVPEARIPDF